MPYGTKRGIKSPGEYGFTDIAGLSVAGAAGIIAALITDYRQQGEASSLYTINQWVSAVGDMAGFANIPLYAVALGLIMVGGLSIFYFQPVTRHAAFAQGFGLLAVLMTAVPADLAGALPASGAFLSLLEPAALSREAARADGVVPASAMAEDARVIAVEDESTARYVVEIEIVFPGGAPADIEEKIRNGDLRGRLHNADTKETFNLFRTVGGDIAQRGQSIIIRAGVPAGADEATLWVRIESDGYAIEEQSAKATINDALNWTITLRPSSTPLFLQRLTKSYWF